MCEHPDVEYTEFPARTIGGASGSYELQCDVTSCQWAEFMIVSITAGDVSGASKVFVTGNGPQPAAAALDYVGTAGAKLNKDTSARGMAFGLVQSTSIFAPMDFWERITDSQKKAFIRIDTPSSNSVYVSLRFRIAKLKIIPAPATTVHPDHAHQMNIARADATRQRLGLVEEIKKEESISEREKRINVNK